MFLVKFHLKPHLDRLAHELAQRNNRHQNGNNCAKIDVRPQQLCGLTKNPFQSTHLEVESVRQNFVKGVAALLKRYSRMNYRLQPRALALEHPKYYSKITKPADMITFYDLHGQQIHRLQQQNILYAVYCRYLKL